jgi:uracil-DNA glycosylase
VAAAQAADGHRAAVNALQRNYLARLGIAVWELREPKAVEPEAAASLPVSRAEVDVGVGLRPEAGRSGEAPTDEVAAVWETLRSEVSACTRCALHRGRKQAVFGVGRTDASLMIVGEAPGAEEDRRGEPFVGPAGQLLNAMLRSIGFAREDVFIANVLKCRPPNNRDPSGDEAASCSAYLERQIALVQPRAMLAVGRISAQWLLQTDSSVGRLRGKVHRFGDMPLVVTYHPAYLLRSPSEKAKSWQDLCMVRSLVTAQP